MMQVEAITATGRAVQLFPGSEFDWWARLLTIRHPLVQEAFRFGDRAFFEAHPELDHSPILVHFHATESRYDRVEQWGVPADYCYRGE